MGSGALTGMRRAPEPTSVASRQRQNASPGKGRGWSSMRKSFVLVLALVAALVALAAASAASAASIYATGAGSQDFAGNKHFIQFELSAHSGPQGDHGKVRFQINPP